MKKMMIALMCAIGSMVAFGDTVTNVYNMSMSLKTPTLYSGVRTPTSQSYKGYMYIEYVDGEVNAAWADVVSSKTKVAHSIVFTDGFYNLMGKTTKSASRSVPTVYLTGADVEVCGGASKYGSHETIKVINIAGFGSLKSTKTVIKGCSACGEPESTTEYCNILYSVTGNANGVMDCECPEEEDWWHTLKAGICGVWYNDAFEYERQHEASFYGSWKITYNAKLNK